MSSTWEHWKRTPLEMISSAREWRAGVEVRAELAVVILVEREVALSAPEEAGSSGIMSVWRNVRTGGCKAISNITSKYLQQVTYSFHIAYSHREETYKIQLRVFRRARSKPNL